MVTDYKLVPPLKFFGGKNKICKWIHKIAEPIKDKYFHRVYVFGGGAGECWDWGYEGVSEIYNDIDLRLTNFFSILQNEYLFEKFLRKIEATPFSQPEWEQNHFLNTLSKPSTFMDSDDQKVTMAIALFVDCRQSLSGQMKGFAPLSKTRLRRGMNEQVSAWLGGIEGLKAVHNRLIRMVIKNQGWERIIDSEDSGSTLFYLDPPYLTETRVSKDVYKYEFDFNEHVLLLRKLENIQGKFMLSGYHSHLYDEWASKNNYEVHELSVDCKASHKDKKDKRTEVIWTNF